MCLAIPGKVLAVEKVEGIRLARVQFGGIVRAVSLDLVPEAVVGDYVIVHVGYAISRLDEAEARRTFELLRVLGPIEELALGDQPA
ncbi:MAG TPA: HypC/HybG/HupF family hydrogenase formation chaperone [Terriglobales bacterium]|nr:HypC/HybG/HupF family hydrogenase formation chaperone [Terriglobales bacterium]